MTIVKSGDTVRVHYTGTLADGSTFDSSAGRDPLEFKVGEHQVIPGFESAIEGMTVGDTKTITIPVAEAYGDYRDDMVMKVEKSQVPPDVTPEVGMQLQLQSPEGQVLVVVITEVADDYIVLDGNHPLAGKDLTFALELVEVV